MSRCVQQRLLSSFGSRQRLLFGTNCTRLTNRTHKPSGSFAFPLSITQYRFETTATKPPSKSQPRLVHKSYTSYILIFVFACGSAYLVDSFNRTRAFGNDEETTPTHRIKLLDLESGPTTSDDPFFTEMAILPGHRGNLTPEQEIKLRELWEKTLKVFGVDNPNQPNGKISLEVPHEEVHAGPDTDKKRKKSRISLFGRKHDDAAPASGNSSPNHDPSRASMDGDDKYGQVKEFQQIVAAQTPESLRKCFWSMVKGDHPDALLLRFLRARKWDVDKALFMMISTMSWRGTDMHVDDDLIMHGEGGASADCSSTDANVKREGNDFLQQLRLGKSFLHGADNEGRPVCFVRARLHHSGDQTDRSVERVTVYIIETARLTLRPPVETATILFDMTDFSMSNMDYAPVKFMIKIFEANYPESLGAILVHKAPWIFNAIWSVIKGWLDPVVASKVHFTKNVDELTNYIPRSQIIKELGGTENWDYKFIEPVPGENDLMKDTQSRDRIQEERNQEVSEYQSKTFEWIAAGPGAGDNKIKEERDAVARRLYENYWRLDPYIRARTLYDRVGMIEPGGKINFYPSHDKPVIGAGGGRQAPMASTSADDVD